MREILFKAKRLDNGEWVEGSYVKDFNKSSNGFKHCIFVISKCKICEKWNWQYYEIDSKTLCQYTGLTDKNGKKIWENDIVNGIESCLDGFEHDYRIKVIFNFMTLARIEYSNEVEVIGNIFDNPELVEV